MNAITKKPIAEIEAKKDSDAGLWVTREQLERLGGGDHVKGRRELRLLLALEKDGPVLNAPSRKPASVRVAHVADEPALLKLLLLDLEMNAAQVAVIDEEKVLAKIQIGTRGRGGVVGVIDGPDGTPIAMVVAQPEQWWWSQAWYFSESVNFVHPDHRRSNHINDLMNFCRWWVDAQSKLQGTRVYFLGGVMGWHRVRAKIAKFRRQFFQVGAVFMYPPPPNGKE